MAELDLDNIPKVKEACEINDIRTGPQFKGISFSNYKKTEVRKQFIESIKKGKVEQSCYWCAELICAGHYLDVWENIFHYFGKHIHLGNPKIIIYLEMRYTAFRNILDAGQFVNELQLRNHPQFRKLFAEIVGTLVISNKTHSFEPIRINRVEEFDLTQMSERLKATKPDYAAAVFLKQDPKELYIAINEFNYHLSKDSANTINACYWIEWVIDFDAICKKRKEPCLCEKRNTFRIENKYGRDIVWLLWDSLLHNAAELKNAFIDKLMSSLLNIFCVKYTTASAKKRRYLLYFAVSLLTQPVPTHIELINDKKLIQNVIERIDTVYKQIKKNEVSPNTDYLFANLTKQHSLESSLMKMEMVNKMDFAANI
jgi:cytochrome b involved in lipid metabolism